MKVSYVHDTETGKTQVQLFEAAWAIHEPDDSGSKILVFGADDDSFDVFVPMGPEAVNKIAAALLTKPASRIVPATVSDIEAIRKGGPANGS